MPAKVVGLYERLITRALREQINALPAGQVVASPPDVGDAHVAVADHLRRILARVLESLPEDDRLTSQAELANAILEWLQANRASDATDAEESLVVPLAMLREIRSLERGRALAQETPQPLVPLSAADLLVNARGEPSIAAAIHSEIHSADRIDLVCAFIRWNGLRLIRPALEAHRQSGKPFRVVTTVYTGSTERRALDWLASVGAEVKVSYDTRTTRLHAKAWLFDRDTGFSTAFIGSSNLTHSAMLDGVEWNVRLAEVATPGLIDKFRATFEGYWADADYEPYDPARDAERFDRAVQTPASAEPSLVFHLDVQPWPFQREMLERLEVERTRHGRHRNLVVAATGTGKTLVAAFDYRRLKEQMGNPSLLFVAHRREILSQSLAAYRAVLRDGSFGELLVDGRRPVEHTHLFASIQSLSQIDLDEIDPDAFDIVVVDEFHHAAAPTYDRLLKHLRPRILLGLTATPERTDGQDVLQWFDGRIAVELRLWDALERGLLCPFQYFGLSDGTDLSQLKWSRRGYDISALENVYTGDSARVALILQAILDKVSNPGQMRALGFCVSVAHAHFMADRFSERGLASVAVSATTPGDVRESMLRELRAGSIRVVFCVDLFNEGVDVPEIDTVLFLRPTESPLIFLQQLGRGLRRSDHKACLTVLDFVGGAHRRFRYDLRFRALIGGTRQDVIRQIESRFPRLPSGCSIQLDRVAERVVLDNVRAGLGSGFAGLVMELRSMADGWRHQGRDPNRIDLGEFVREAAIDIQDVYRGDEWTWSRLRRAAGLDVGREGPEERRLRRALSRLLHVDDPSRLALYRRAGLGTVTPAELDPNSFGGRALMGLHFVLWGPGGSLSTLKDSLHQLGQHPAIAAELAELAAVLEDRATHVPVPLDDHMRWAHQVPLAVHSRASLDEILAAFGRMTFSRQGRLRQGVDFDPATQSDLFFVTLEKSEDHYSPSTMYRDYAISSQLFHWESQSTTSTQSPTGQRYLNHQARGSHVLLFVRHRKHDDGRTAAYTCLGAADYVSHSGSRPIAITWKLRQAMPEDFFRDAKIASG